MLRLRREEPHSNANQLRQIFGAKLPLKVEAGIDHGLVADLAKRHRGLPRHRWTVMLLRTTEPALPMGMPATRLPFRKFIAGRESSSCASTFSVPGV